MSEQIRTRIMRMQRDYEMPEKFKDILLKKYEATGKIRLSTGIITKDKVLAHAILYNMYDKNKEYVKTCLRDKHRLIYRIIFESGEEIFFIYPNESSKGLKLTGAYIDEETDDGYFDYILKPMLMYADGSNIFILQDELK